MVIDPKDAQSYRCCSNPEKVCQGNHCMAWRREMREVRDPRDHPLAPPKVEPTGRGYCGLAYR